MILLQFKHSFRERIAEWITTIAMIVWGLLVNFYGTIEFVSKSHVDVLANIMAIPTWGLLALMVGVIRLAALMINGYWRPTAHFRVFGAITGTILWGALVLSYFASPTFSSAIAYVSALFAIDMANLLYASSDAKIADVQARRVTEYGE